MPNSLKRTVHCKTMNSRKTTPLVTFIIAFIAMYYFLEELTLLQKYNSKKEASKEQVMIPRGESDWSKDCHISNSTGGNRNRYASCLRGLDISEKMECSTSCQETIQRIRKEHLRSVCTNLASESVHPSIGLWDENGDIQKEQLYRLDHLFSIDKSQLIYCSIPKVATTAWRKLLLVVMGEVNSTNVLTEAEVHARFRDKARTLSSYNIAEAQRRLKSYKKFFFVRNPLERMLSLFLDKAVKERYWSFNESQFEMFLEFINKKPVEPVYKTVAEHWALGSHLCFPCDVSYDFIGRTETTKRDTQFIFDHFILTNRDRLMMTRVKGHATNSSDSHKKEKYYRKISKDVLTNFTDKYLLDYLLFSYDKPAV